MIDPILVTPENALDSGVTYEQLLDEGMKFLAHCGQFTMIEQAQHGAKHPALSANECLGMATRVIAEQALKIQILADEEERNVRSTD